MSDPNNPTLYCTEKEAAWDAWQKAFDAGGVHLPDHDLFEKWFGEVYLKLGEYSLHDRMQAAWSAGVLDRNEQSTAAFNGWWQAILDGQPKA